MKVEINRQLLGLEDQLFGVGTVTQTRNGEAVVVTKINAANLPFDETKSLKEVIASLTNLNLVAAHIAAVDLVGADIVSVVRTALSANNIDIVILNLTNIDKVANSIGNVNLTGTSITNVNIIGNDLSLGGYDGTLDNGLITDPVLDTPLGSSAIQTVSTNIDEVKLVALNMNLLLNLSGFVAQSNINFTGINSTGTIIPKGTIVMLDAYIPGELFINIKPTVTSQDIAIGMVMDNIANGASGLILRAGLLANINTVGKTPGEILYSWGGGVMTNVIPTTGNYQILGSVYKVATDGNIMVSFDYPMPTTHSIANAIDTVDFILDLGAI